jgi:hypothetical protein
MLPANTIDWIINQPETNLSNHDVLRTLLSYQHTFSVPSLTDHPLHHETVVRDLTRQLGALTSAISDEISASLDDYWGTDSTQWREVCLLETMMRVVARASNRMFVGYPMCKLTAEDGAFNANSEQVATRGSWTVHQDGRKHCPLRQWCFDNAPGSSLLF